MNDYEFRVENKLCNTSESNPGGLWKILNNFKRLKTRENWYWWIVRVSKIMNRSNEVGIPILTYQISMIILTYQIPMIILTYQISMIIVLPMQSVHVYHHWCCEFESWSGRGLQHYVIKFVSDLWQVGSFFRVLRFPPPIKLTATI